VKNKKLFAILTLVCFMFTLMPVAAFADTVEETAKDQVYVVVSGEETTYEADAEVVSGNPFTVAVGQDEGAPTAENFAFYVVDEDGDGVYATTESSITLRAEGDYKVFAINNTGDKFTSFINEVGDIVEKVNILKTYTTLNAYDAAEVTVVADEYDYKITLSEEDSSIEISANNGFDKGDGEVTATLWRSNDGKELDAEDKVWEKVRKGYELTFTTVGYVDVVTEKGTVTNSSGAVKFEVVSDVAGDNYKVIVKYGKEAKATLDVDVTSVSATNVVVNNEPVAPQNIETPVIGANVEFKFTDNSGVATNIDIETKETATVDYAITLVSKPAGSKLEAKNFVLVKQSEDLERGIDQDAKGVYTLNCTKGDMGFDKEGTYEIKVSLENGASATATVKAAEMGDVVRIMFVKAPTTVAYGEGATVNKVVAVDANGVMDSEIEYTLSASGIAIDTFDNGALTVKDDPDYIGSKISVLAVYNDEFTATTELTVVDKAATIKYMSNTAEVGVNATLVGNIVDGAGKVTAIEKESVESVQVIVLDKPENAVAVANSVYPNALSSKGQVVVSFLASAAGEYKVQTIVTYDVAAEGEDPVVKYISGIETITVGAKAGDFKDVVVVSLGADKMIVNSEVVALDVAPFIENNRTMMQFNVLYVFGIDVEWVAETQSVVAEGNGVKVVMQLGSKVATVNGEEVTLDVAPYSVNGRTVVPVGLITGVLDITPTFTYNADGSIADILFAK